MTARLTFALFASLSLLAACPEPDPGVVDGRHLADLSLEESRAICSARVQLQADEFMSGMTHLFCVLGSVEENDACVPAAVGACISESEAGFAGRDVTVSCDLKDDHLSHLETCTDVTVDEWQDCLDAQVDRVAGLSAMTCANLEELEVALESPPAACAALFAACPRMENIVLERIVDYSLGPK